MSKHRAGLHKADRPTDAPSLAKVDGIRITSGAHHPDPLVRFFARTDPMNQYQRSLRSVSGRAVPRG